MLRLVVGNLNYSSWSMRAWLGLRLAGLEFQTHDVHIYTKPGHKERILAFSGAGQVPVLIDGALSVHQSLAILEWAAERVPEAKLWPVDAQLRARGRAISCEMLSGFAQVRTKMPCNLRGRANGKLEDAELVPELERLFDVFEASLATSTGEYLLGDFSIADCMYMPVLSRFRTYGVPISTAIRAYSERVFAHPLVQELEQIARGTESIPQFDARLGRALDQPGGTIDSGDKGSAPVPTE